MAPTKRVSQSDATTNDGSNKRQRVDEQTLLTNKVSFHNINIDCKVHILSFLCSDDMNSFAMCSRDCRHARANESLDQTRTATIVWTDRSTTDSFLDKVRDNRHVLTGNKPRLKIVGLEKSVGRPFSQPRQLSWRLEGVTSLDCSYNGRPGVNRGIDYVTFQVVISILPSLQAINLTNNVKSPESGRILGAMALYCPFLSEITWNGCKHVNFCGDLLRTVTGLTHLNLDSSVIGLHMFDENSSFLLMKCRRLEYLSIKDVTIETETGEAVLLSQEVMIDMVRRHPTLRWLRSDLTADNVEMLKQERPDITFVSD